MRNVIKPWQLLALLVLVLCALSWLIFTPAADAAEIIGVDSYIGDGQALDIQNEYQISDGFDGWGPFNGDFLFDLFWWLRK